MFLVCVIAVLCLVSLGHSAPLTCEDLVQPLDQLDPRHLEGRWTLAASSMNDSAYLERYKSRDSAFISFANTSEASKISFSRSFGFSTGCEYLHSNISLEGSNFIIEPFNFTVTFLRTSCPDCLLMRFEKESRIVLHLFSKRREVGQKTMEELGAQGKCLNLLPPVAMDPTKELCPGEVSRGKEKTHGQKV